MKKNIKYSNILLLPFLLSSCNSIDLKKNAPDYSSSKGEFITFGYSSPTDGSYEEDSEVLNTGEDYRTVERYKEYKEAGLNTMMIQGHDDPYDGKDWENSQLKKNMDNCVAAGITRCIVFDYRIQALSAKESPIVGEGLQFETQEELNEYVAECMKDYANHEVFYGIMIRDEPTHEILDAYGSVYKAIKAYRDCYIESNLLPFHTTDSAKKRYSPNYATETSEESYRYYINKYLECTGAEKILMDSYPFRVSNGNPSMLDSHLRGCQILADICKENDLKFEAVAQTYGGSYQGVQNASKMTMATMEWQTNCYMGFGVQTFGYFTYWRKQANSRSGEWFDDGSSFITQHGEKTDIYYSMQTIHSEMQQFAPTMLNFEYQASNAYIFAPVAYSTGYATMNEEEFSLINKDSFEVETGHIALVNELKDHQTGQYMYMVMNALNPLLKENDDKIVMDYSVNFGKEYTAAEVYYRGNMTLVPLKNGVYTSTLDAGYAEYIMPYKA